MRISDGSSDVCSSDLAVLGRPEGRRHRARADALHQRRHRGGVAEPRAVVHVVGAEGGADQLLEEIGLLVRALGRAEAGKALGAARRIDLVEAPSRLLQRLLPTRLAEVRPGITRIDLVVTPPGIAVEADAPLGPRGRTVCVAE